MVIGNHGKTHLEPGTDGACTDDAPVFNEDIDAAAERRLVRKLDVIIIPTFFIIYMMSFLDRINISNARIQDMPKDLDLSGKKFNVALLVYYASYILLEIPSNMIVKKVRPSLYMSTLMFSWGVVNMCMGFVHSYQALVGLRFMLGVFEAGVLPAIVYITSTYYKRHECQKRMSLLFCSTVVAGAFGGLLAFAIGKLGGREGFRAWRWIFIIEGAITALLAVVASFTIIDWPEQTKYLNREEKELLRRRTKNDVGDMVRMDTLNKFSFQLIASDYKIWLGGLMYFGVGVAGLSGAMFLPTILVEFHWEPEQAQVRTIPVYVFAAGTMLLGAYASDRLKHRFGFIVGGASMTTVGYAMLLSQDGKTRDYKFAAVFLVFGGAYMIAPMALVWLQNNVSGHWKRSFAASTQVMVGNVAGIVGSLIFVPDESPRYTTGYSVSLCLMWVGICAALAMFMLMRRENGNGPPGAETTGLLCQKTSRPTWAIGTPILDLLCRCQGCGWLTMNSPSISGSAPSAGSERNPTYSDPTSGLSSMRKRGQEGKLSPRIRNEIGSSQPWPQVRLGYQDRLMCWWRRRRQPGSHRNTTESRKPRLVIP